MKVKIQIQHADNCYPADIWADTLQSGKSYHAIDLNNGSYRVTGPCGTGYCPNTLAFSVRCLLLALDGSAAKPPYTLGCGALRCVDGYHCSLQLCDYYSDTKYTPGSVRCTNVGYCKGAATGSGDADNCYPNALWSGSFASGTFYHYAGLNNGTYTGMANCAGSAGCRSTDAFSVRCVTGYYYSLQLCNNYWGESSGSGSVRCTNVGYCKGAGSQATTGQTKWVDNCYPYGIWSGTLSSGTQYLDTELNNGNLNVDVIRPHTLAFSVRGAVFGYK